MKKSKNSSKTTSQKKSVAPQVNNNSELQTNPASA